MLRGRQQSLLGCSHRTHLCVACVAAVQLQWEHRKAQVSTSSSVVSSRWVVSTVRTHTLQWYGSGHVRSGRVC